MSGYRKSIKYRASSSLASARAMRGALQRRAAFGANRTLGRRTTVVSTKALRAAAGEKKGVDTDLAAATVISSTNTNGNAICLNLIQQGSGSWNRVGRKVLLKSVRLRGYFGFVSEPGTIGEVASNSCRMVVVWDKQPNGGAIPTFDTIFGITDQTGAESVTDILNPPRYDNMDRFRVLKDCVQDFDPGAFSGSGTTPELSVRYQFDEYIKLNNLETNYSASNNPSTIADISTGALYVYFRAVNNSAISLVGIDGSARLRYTD